jgi:hypothetical protein
MATLPDSRLADGARSDGEPRRSWTLTVPFLLTLPASAWCVLIALITSMYRCFDTCMPSDRVLNAIGVAEFILAVATAGTLTAGLAMPRWRRALRRVIWIACLLAWAGAGVLWAWEQAHP